MENSAFLFLILLGLPVCLIFLVAVLRSLKAVPRGVHGDIFTLGLSLMLLVTVVVVRLELARVAAFSMPIIVACVASEITRRPVRSLLMHSLTVSAAQYLETYAYLSQALLLSRLLGYPVA
jgi:hypothetical protein